VLFILTINAANVSVADFAFHCDTNPDLDPPVSQSDTNLHCEPH
jgi:hypothetical protein